MVKKLKLSPWHDGSVKPVHVGWYQVKNGDFAAFEPGPMGKGKGYSAWRKWNGARWFWINLSGQSETATFYKDDAWRGVLK